MINVTVIKPEVSYPKLRIFNKGDMNMIVLFRTENIGIVVDTNTNDYSDFFKPIGFYSSKWNSKIFKDYDGEVTLFRPKYNLMYNNKNIVLIDDRTEQSNGDAIEFILDGYLGEGLFQRNYINKADYEVFNGTIILKNKDE